MIHLLLVATTLLLLGAAAERTYVDSKGDAFTIAEDATPPKIIINANGALSLFHLGLPISQLVAVYDHWVIRGSTIDLGDTSGGGEPDLFGIDPTAEEIAFLRGAENLSPECTLGSAGCALNFNAKDLGGLEYDFFVAIRAGINTLAGKQDDLGHKIIWIDDKYEHNAGCYGTEGESIALIANEENCYSLSLIDVVVEIERLATFLGIEPTERVRGAKRAMCDSAARFVAHSQGLRDKGIYAAAVSMRPFNGITMNWFPPNGFPWLRTLEELGFPLLHPPNSTKFYDLYTVTLADWFVNCDNWPFCQDGTGKLSVDLWLLDSRTYAAVRDDVEGSKVQFPDPAFVDDQYTYWQFNDGAISYTGIARYLDDIVSATSDIQRVHTDNIACAENIDVTSREYNNRANGGLSVPRSGTYACRGNTQSLYTECPGDVMAPAPLPAPDAPGSAPFPNQRDDSSYSSGSARLRATVRTAVVLPIFGTWLLNAD